LIEEFHESPLGKGGDIRAPAAEWESPGGGRLRGRTPLAKIIVGIALAMRYLHCHGIIHCNLSPDAIVVDWHCNVRVRDFTYSFEYGVDPSPTNVGTLSGSQYRALECYDDRFLRAIDVFSFGLILCRLIVGQPPFPGLSPYAVAKRIAFDDVRPEIPDSVPPLVRELISDCWATDRHSVKS
jgi:serine/threonine protein kinase